MKKSQKIEVAIVIVIIAVVLFCIFFFQIRSNRSESDKHESVVYDAESLISSDDD